MPRSPRRFLNSPRPWSARIATNVEPFEEVVRPYYFRDAQTPLTWFTVLAGKLFSALQVAVASEQALSRRTHEWPTRSPRPRTRIRNCGANSAPSGTSDATNFIETYSWRRTGLSMRGCSSKAVENDRSRANELLAAVSHSLPQSLWNTLTDFPIRSAHPDPPKTLRISCESETAASPGMSSWSSSKRSPAQGLR
jgi:hypothetical protein